MKSPKKKKGFVFTGWATFNWGICHQYVYRTRKAAIENLRKGINDDEDWRKYFTVQKVKCKVI